jgi:hypothetical protein
MNMIINAAISRQINTTIGMMYSIDDIFESFLTGADGSLAVVGVGDDVGVELSDDAGDDVAKGVVDNVADDDVLTNGGAVLDVF